MKVGQKIFVRWMSKLAAKGAGRLQQKQSATALREIDSEYLRQVSGGVGASTNGPNRGW